MFLQLDYFNNFVVRKPTFSGFLTYYKGLFNGTLQVQFCWYATSLKVLRSVFVTNSFIKKFFILKAFFVTMTTLKVSWIVV